MVTTLCSRKIPFVNFLQKSSIYKETYKSLFLIFTVSLDTKVDKLTNPVPVYSSESQLKILYGVFTIKFIPIVY